MSKVCEITVNVDEALSVNKYEVDEETPHIELAEDDGSEAYNEEFLKLVRVCPAALYKIDGDGAKSFAWSAAPAASPARAPSSRSGSTPARRWASSTAWASICSAPERRLRLIAQPEVQRCERGFRLIAQPEARFREISPAPASAGSGPQEREDLRVLPLFAFRGGFASSLTFERGFPRQLPKNARVRAEMRPERCPRASSTAHPRIRSR